MRAAAATFSAAALLTVSGCSPRVTTIGVSAQAMDGVFIEAESGTFSGAMVIASDSTASGGQFIQAQAGLTSDDAPGSARAEYSLHASTAGAYLIWGRVHNPSISENRFWLQVDGGQWTKWRITTGEEWFWDAFHDNVSYFKAIEFALAAGEHQLVIANCVDGAGLDRLYFAPNHDAPEPSDSVCNPPHSIELSGVCSPSCGSLAGYCYDTPCAGVGQPTYDCGGCCAPKQ